ncbi:MAG: Ig-like domain-containing protein [Clostridiales Family XIII bacterium]|jgi:hypothetical protein|nr:Ig-like domain-containing protein [Clostridiales Family XIII bacterium]
MKGGGTTTSRRNIGERGLIALAVYAALLTALASPLFAAPVFAAPTDTGQDAEQDAQEAASDEDSAAVEEEGGEASGDTVEPTGPPQPVAIYITDYPRTMTVGDQGVIKYEVENAEEGADVTWRSGDDNIVSVNPDGAVQAFAAGKAEITASLGDARASILISVEERVIVPESFSVEVEGFTPADALLAAHELKVGDELRVSASIDPPDADKDGRFEWTTSGSGVIAVETSGEINENARLTAKTAGGTALTARYIDESEDEGRRVDLGDYTLVFTIIQEEEPVDSPTATTILIAIAAVAAIALITVAVVRGRRRAGYERETRVAHKDRYRDGRDDAARGARERHMADGYEDGYTGGEAEQFDRATRVYGDLPVAPPGQADANGEYAAPAQGQVDANGEYAPPEESGEPEKPFSVDDIE